MWTIQLPLSVQIGRDSWFPLNLNHYRNAHYRELSAAKVSFNERVKPLVGHLPILDRAIIAYTLFVPDARPRDVGNVCSIVDKFFCDVLVKAGKLADDNRMILPIIAFGDGGIDRHNPRVEANIHLIGPNPDITIDNGLTSSTRGQVKS